MVGHVHHRLLVCRGIEGDVQRIVAQYLICGMCRYGSGEVVVAVGRYDGEDER